MDVERRPYPDDDVIGCVYIDPDQLDAAVAAWLASSWPFSSVRYVGRF